MSLPDIVEDTELLKRYPDQALVKEMQNPTGSLGGKFIPPVFIITELKNRQRTRNEQKRREAQDMPTVAEEVVMAAGVPQQGIMQMARSMAPKTNMGQNTGMADMMPKQPTMGMSSGGVVKMQPGGMTGGTMTAIAALKVNNPTLYEMYKDDPALPQIAMAAMEQLETPEFPTIQAGTDIRGADTRASQQLAEFLEARRSDVPGANLPGPATTYEIDPTAALKAGASLSSQQATGGMPAMRDPAVIDPRTGQPYDDLGLMRQQAEQARQAEAQAEFTRSLSTPDELMVPFDSTRDLFDPQSLNQQREDRDRALASEIAASGREDELSTFPVRTGQQNQPQTQELLLPTAQPMGRQSLDGRMVSTVGPTAAEIERAQKVLELNPVTASDEELEVFNEGLKRNTALQNFLKRDREEDSELGLDRSKFAELAVSKGATKQTINGEDFFVFPTGMVYDGNGKLVQGGKAIQSIQAAQEAGENFGESIFGIYDVDAQGDVIPDSYRKTPVDIGNLKTPNIIEKPAAGLAGFLGVEESSAPVTNVDPPVGPKFKSRFGVDKTAGTTMGGDPTIAEGVVEETTKKDKVAELTSDSDLKDTEELIESLDEENKTATINKAAEVVLGTVGKETLAAASGAQGPQAAAQAQQGFSDKQWLDIAALGMMISSGNPADLREASKLFIKLQEASRGRKSKEKIAAADRASREKIAQTAADAQAKALGQRIDKAAKDDLKDRYALLGGEEAYQILSAQLKKDKKLPAEALQTLTTLQSIREKLIGAKGVKKLNVTGTA